MVKLTLGISVTDGDYKGDHMVDINDVEEYYIEGNKIVIKKARCKPVSFTRLKRRERKATSAHEFAEIEMTEKQYINLVGQPFDDCPWKVRLQ